MGKSAVQLDVPDAVSGRVAEAETEVVDKAGAVAENNAELKTRIRKRKAASALLFLLMLNINRSEDL